MQNTGGLLFVWEMSLDLIPNNEGGERKGERDRERKSETGRKKGVEVEEGGGGGREGEIE